MSKRFIDTGLFDDDWFMDLSKDAKILWLYFITKCDHAGIIKLNTRLCKVQTGISDLETVKEQLGNRIITVGEQLFFIPRFVQYQYPGFPNCNFNTAKSAIAILIKHGLIRNGQLIVKEEYVNSSCTVDVLLANSTGISNSNSNGNIGGVGENSKPEFNFRKALIDLGIEGKIVSDWLAVRSKKKASNTETAFKAIRKQIELSGATANDCIKKAVEKSWCGFEAEWYKSNNGFANKSVVNSPYIHIENDSSY